MTSHHCTAHKYLIWLQHFSLLSALLPLSISLLTSLYDPVWSGSHFLLPLSWCKISTVSLETTGTQHLPVFSSQDSMWAVPSTTPLFTSLKTSQHSLFWWSNDFGFSCTLGTPPRKTCCWEITSSHHSTAKLDYLFKTFIICLFRNQLTVVHKNTKSFKLPTIKKATKTPRSINMHKNSKHTVVLWNRLFLHSKCHPPKNLIGMGYHWSTIRMGIKYKKAFFSALWKELEFQEKEMLCFWATMQDNRLPSCWHSLHHGSQTAPSVLTDRSKACTNYKNCHFNF